MPAATPQALDALIAASLQTRREKLLRSVRMRKIQTGFGYGCSGCIALLALAAVFLAHDHAAAASLVVMAFLTASFAYLTGKATQEKLADSLRKMDQSM